LEKEKTNLEVLAFFIWVFQQWNYICEKLYHGTFKRRSRTHSTRSWTKRNRRTSTFRNNAFCTCYWGYLFSYSVVL